MIGCWEEGLPTQKVALRWNKVMRFLKQCQETGCRSVFYGPQPEILAIILLQLHLLVKIDEGKSCHQNSIINNITMPAPWMLWIRSLKRRKPDSFQNRAFGKNSWQRPTLPYSHPYSTIGPAGLICSVRNGKRSYTRGIVARKPWRVYSDRMIGMKIQTWFFPTWCITLRGRVTSIVNQ